METDFIVQCGECGPVSIKANISGEIRDEKARDGIRELLRKEHVWTHRSFWCRKGDHMVKPPHWKVDNRGTNYDGCREHDVWERR